MAYTEDSTNELKEGAGMDLPKFIAAFANTEGGRLVIGVRDDGTIKGVNEKDIDVLQRKIEEYAKEVIPVPTHSIEVREEEGKKIIVVKIYPITDGFCTYKGVLYYRYGSRTERLEGTQLKDFLISRNMIYFDKLPAHRASLEDIDEGKLKEFIKLRSPNAAYSGMENTLKSLGLFYTTSGKPALSNAAILFFGKDPWSLFKQNEVRMVSFLGYDSSGQILDKKDIHLTIPENLEEAYKFIKLNTKASYEIQNLKRVEVPEYPERVIREALVNALVHRDYFSADSVQIRIFSNRIELINPGIPPGGISINDIGRISVKRNPLIYQLMRDMGYMEGLATGIEMMKQEMEKANMQVPEFSIEGSFFITTLYNKLGKRFDFNMLNSRQKHAIEIIRSKGRITSSEYAILNKVSLPTAIADISDMVRDGILKKVGVTRGSFYTINE